MPDVLKRSRRHTDATVSADALDQRLIETNQPADTLNALFDFGTLMLNEVAGRSNALDTKALAVTGWAIALVAFLLAFVSSGRPSHRLLIVLLAPTVAAAVAIVEAFRSVRLRKWSWPSESDWCQLDLLGDPLALRRFHVLAMLETWQHHQATNAAKYSALYRAQIALSVSGAATAAVVAMKILRALNLF